jgi:adenylate cyclase
MTRVDADAWEEAGLLHPDQPGAAERRALLEYLTARGATLEQMVEAEGLGGLPAVAGDLAVGGTGVTLSLTELATRAGIPVGRLRRVLLAAGVPATSESQLPEGVGVLLAAFEQGAALMGDDAILAFTRVLGAAATNISEAAVALFYAELGPGSPREGSDELERAHVAEQARLAFAAVPDVLSRVLLIQFDRAVRRSQVSRGWAVSEAGGASPAGDQPATGAGSSEQTALGFVDLVGSTRWAEGLSLRDQSLALGRFESAAWASAVEAGGRVIKMIGDEVFFTAPSVEVACRIALDVCQAVSVDPLLPPARGAVGYGLVTPREGDIFGPLVNLVARLVKVAVAGSVVVTAEGAAALPRDRWVVQQIDAARLPGLERPVDAFVVRAMATPPG